MIDTITETQTTKRTAQQSLALDFLDHAHVAWRTCSYNPTDFRIFYATSAPGGVWSAPLAVSENGANSPAIALSTVTGDPFIVFDSGEEEYSEIHLAYRSEGVWHDERITENDRFDRFPTIAIDASGSVHLAWITSDPVTEIYALAYAVGSAGDWQVQTLSGSENPLLATIAVSAGGAAHIVYRGGYPPGYRIHHAWNDLRGGIDWHYEVITSGNDADLLSSLVVAPDGDLHLAVGGHGPDFGLSPREVYYLQKPDGGAWSPAEFIASSAYSPCLDLDADDNPHIIWMEMDIYLPVLETGNLYHSYRDGIGNWHTAFAAGSDYFGPSFKIDGEGHGRIACYTGGSSFIFDICHIRSGGVITGSGEDPHSRPPAPRITVNNYPNPFNATTTIRLAVPDDCRVTADILDSSGMLINRLLSSELRPAGVHYLQWNGRNESGRIVSSGIYYCVLQTGTDVVARKIVLLR